MAQVLTRNYTEVEIHGDLDEVMETLQRKTIPCYCLFNGVILTTDDTVDTAYVKVCGMNKKQYERAVNAEHRKMQLKRALKKIFR